MISKFENDLKTHEIKIFKKFCQIINHHTPHRTLSTRNDYE